MPSTSERRQGSDRRKTARGGRRPYDKPGFSPLVLVVGDGHQPEKESEAILARLNFAVAPAVDLAEAKRVIGSLNPDLIVASADDAEKLRADRVSVPIVESRDHHRDADALVQRIRFALRQVRT
jgi:PleD family two-component response regulator